MNDMPSALWLTTNDALTRFCQSLEAAPYIALDTEFMRRTTYHPKLCLLQICYKDKLALIDPLIEGLDLTPLQQLIYNPRIIKVVHAGSQDMEILYKRWGSVPENVLDTQIMAMFLGLSDNIGLSTLCEAQLGIPLDKSQQNINWAKRPLSPKAMQYAANDAVYLARLFDALYEKLGAKRTWAQEECATLFKDETFEFSPKNAWKKFKLPPHSLSKENAQLLYCCVVLREAIAAKQNILPKRLIDDMQLMAIVNAQDPEKAINALTIKERALFLDLLHNPPALEAYEEKWVSRKVWPTRSALPREKFKKIKQHVAVIAEKYNLYPTLVATKKDIEKTLQGKPSRLDQGWRAPLWQSQEEAHS